MMILKGYLFSICYALVCLAFSFVLYKFGLDKKYTRKVVHILVGFEWVILNHFFGAGLYFLSVCLFFLVLLTVAYIFKLMPMLSSDGENSAGTVYYAVAMTGVGTVACFVPEVMVPFGIAIACTSIGDGVAGVVGQALKKHNPKVFENKSLFGTLANFLACFASAFIISDLYDYELSILACVVIAAVSVQIELITRFGLDNITITWGITALAYFLGNFGETYEYLIPILLTIPIIIFVSSKKALTPFATLCAVALDIIVAVSMGNRGFVLLLLFFGGSIAIDKVKSRARSEIDGDRKPECRSSAQVFANGAVSAIFAVAYIVYNDPLFIICYCAALAEAFGDTAASGFGAFSKKTYDIAKFRSIEKGLSGGISLIGTAGALLCVALFGAVSGVMFSFEFKDFLIIISAAFAGVVFDSILGSLLQIKYRCEKCNKITEKQIHCDSATVKSSGLAFVDNNTVNFVSNTFSAFLALALVIFL